MTHITITIDGPAGSGKGTVAKLLAEKLSYKTLDSGAIYRGISLFLLEKGIAVENFKESDLDGLVVEINDQNRVFVNSEDVTNRLRTHENSASSSKFSGIIAIRNYANKIQREITKDGGYILDGRDAGTVVLPDAELKIYLDADLEVRAQRKLEQVGDNDKSLEELKNEMHQRDEFDKNKEFGALKKPDEAIIVDNTHGTIEDAVNKIYESYLEKTN